MPISPPEPGSETTKIRISRRSNKGMSPIRFRDEQAAWINKTYTHKCDTGPVEDPMQGSRSSQRTKENIANPYNEEPQTGKDVIFMPQMARSTKAPIKF
jgi:hypothetical protein